MPLEGLIEETADLLLEHSTFNGHPRFFGYITAVPATRERGVHGGAAEGADTLRVYVSEETHTWIEKAADLYGLGTDAIRWLPTDDRLRMRAAFAYHPPYYHFGEEALRYVDYGPQNSRGFRALKVWLALRQAGREGYERMIGDDIRLTETPFDAVGTHPELEAGTRELSIATFRYVPRDLAADAEARGAYLDELNREVLERLERSGRAFVSKAVVADRLWLRSCIVNFRTQRSDVLALPEIVAEIGREADAELR